MTRVAHIIGNGDNAPMYKPAKGLKITCNLPPFTVENCYTTCIVDFKMCMAITDGSVTVPGDWVLGFRPKIWYDKNKDNFRMRFGHHIKEFYTVLPKYAGNYTNLNCGHFAAHYTANRLQAKEIHLYGFDSLFDMNLRSCTDFYLGSDRGTTNNVRLNDNWRPIWQKIFEEFKDTQFVLHHNHDKLKFPKGENVEIVTK
jgi:hypothetical protein